MARLPARRGGWAAGGTARRASRNPAKGGGRPDRREAASLCPAGHKKAPVRNFPFHTPARVKSRIRFRPLPFSLCTKTGEGGIIVLQCAVLTAVYGGLFSVCRGRGGETPCPCFALFCCALQLPVYPYSLQNSTFFIMKFFGSNSSR